MANTLNEKKERIVYAEWTPIREELDRIAREMSKKEGRDISEAELIRRITLDFANKARRRHGKKPLVLDPASAPGGNPNTKRSVG